MYTVPSLFSGPSWSASRLRRLPGASPLVVSSTFVWPNLDTFSTPPLQILGAAAQVAPTSQIIPYSTKYYTVCGLGGILSCGITHTSITPVDLIKCNVQVDPAKYSGIVQGAQVLVKEGGGIRALARGWVPTIFGYSIQGMFKFGLYEVFKKKYSDLVGEETADRYRSLLYMFASGSAEFVADIGLAPFEAVKVRVQTSPTFARGLADGLPKILREEGMNGLYKGLSPLWFRQIPYTIIKFVAYERVVEGIYKYAITRPKEDYNKLQQLGVSLAGGYIAGVFCAIVSHPADTIVSKLNQVKTDGGNLAAIKEITREVGIIQLFIRGLMPRIFMIGTLTGFQWLIYDTVKVATGLPTTGRAK